MKNYYRILNVVMNASDEDIKHSFRTLAKRYHPDVNPDDKTSARRFADINEAYDVLSDPQKRAEYDAQLRALSAQQEAARQAAAAQQQRPVDGAWAQAQFMAQVNAQVNAQLQPVRDRAYKDGYATGYRSGSQNAQQAVTKSNARIKALTAENEKLKTATDTYRRDRAELEQELFERDREISRLAEQEKELQSKIEWLRKAADGNGAGIDSAEQPKSRSSAQADPLRSRASDSKRRVETLLRDIEANAPSEPVSDDTTVAQNNRRKQIKQELDKLDASIGALADELRKMEEENKRREELARTEYSASTIQLHADEWAQKVKEDRKLAKNTHYGTLGVLIWATDAEIDAAYNLLEQQLQNRDDAASIAKFAQVKEAYTALVSEERRKEYNKTIGISPEKVEYERRLIRDHAKIQEAYRASMSTKEFWTRFDELTSLAFAGNPHAQNTLGEIYYNGKFIKRDYEQAIYWFREAFAQRNAAAIYNLGVCYRDGHGTHRNKAIAESLFRQAENLGYRPKNEA